MAYTRCQLLDPGNVLPVYSWDVNYNQEGEFGQRRNLEPMANTAGGIYVVQQGQDDPLQISVSGTMLRKSQHQTFVRYFKVCRERTVIFTDFEGAMFEVMISGYLPVRQRAARNPRGLVEGNFYHTYTYTLEMMVMQVLSGDWALV